MSANDPDDFVRRETDWLKVPLKEDRPFLGICLGAQMLVNHLGGKVEGHGDGPGRDRLVSARADRGRQGADALARDGLSVPPRGLLAALAAPRCSRPPTTYQNQAFRYGDNAWGIQFHAELTRDDDAALGRARRAPLRPARRPARPRSSRRPDDLGHAPEAMAGRVSRDDLRQAKAAISSRRVPADAGCAAVRGTGRPDPGDRDGADPAEDDRRHRADQRRHRCRRETRRVRSRRRRTPC